MFDAARTNYTNKHYVFKLKFISSVYLGTDSKK